jgi:hypothetical protein
LNWHEFWLPGPGRGGDPPALLQCGGKRQWLLSMSRSRSQRSFSRRAAATALVLAGVTLVAGCSATSIADHVPTAAGGLPEAAPRSAKPLAYPAVHDMPPPRDNTVLSGDEQQKLETELAAARDRLGGQNTSTGKPAASARKP